MSRALFSRNPDLKRLRDEGYFVQQQGGHVVMREVPYVDAHREVRIGTLISSLLLAGDQTRPPNAPGAHVVHWNGDFPCRADGTPIQGISHQAGAFDLGHGLKATHSFSSKPDGGYTDYHHKMTSYANIIAGPAAVLKPGATPRTFREPEEEEDSVFNYVETASDRVGIGLLTERGHDVRLALHPVLSVKRDGSGKLTGDKAGEFKSIATTMMGELTSAEQEVYQTKNESNQDPLNFPIKLNNEIAGVATFVGQGEYRPTKQAYQVFDELKVELDKQLKALKSSMDNNLPKLNAILRAVANRNHAGSGSGRERH